jgi:hypothetical protein
VGCDARDPADCLNLHVRPWLADARPTEGCGYEARAPCHDDAKRSLTISLGARRTIVWCCHACQKRLGKDAAQVRTRSALITAGVSGRCLPLTREQVDSMVDQFRELLHSDIAHPDKVYRLAALIECGEMPKGSELDRLAEWSGVSRRAAYDATKRARQGPTDNL